VIAVMNRKPKVLRIAGIEIPVLELAIGVITIIVFLLFVAFGTQIVYYLLEGFRNGNIQPTAI
jgi:FtsH-binding integral membrane protein